MTGPLIAYVALNTPNSYRVRRETGEAVKAEVVARLDPLPEPDPTAATRERTTKLFIVRLPNGDLKGIGADENGTLTLDGEPVKVDVADGT